MENIVKNPEKFVGNELKYLKKVLTSEKWSSTSGSWNQILEREFSKKFGAKYGITFNSGTSTLQAALQAAGIGPGDEVISPALTVIMDAIASFHVNAIPVFADINPNTFTIDPKDIERKITPRTKAIITVSTYGLPPDMDPIMELAKKNNLIVIEDNAQCFLSRYKEKMIGTIGHMASYSFENIKHMSCGEGGIVITNHEKLAEKVRKIGACGYQHLRADEGRVKLNKDFSQNPNYKRHDEIGWNFRLSEFSAAIALAQLEQLDKFVDMRIQAAKLFLEVIKDCEYLIPQKTPEGYTNSYWSLAVVYNGQEKIGVSWKDFRKEYIKQGGDGYYGAWSVPYLEPVIAERKYVHRYPQIYKDIYYKKGLCPIAEDIQSKLMQIKTNYRSIELAKKKAEALKRTIAKFN